MDKSPHRRRVREPAKDDVGETASISIRLPTKKIEEIYRYWTSHGMANRAEFLEKAVDLYLDIGDMVNSGTEIKMSGHEVPDKGVVDERDARITFVRDACSMLLSSVMCSHCGCINLGSGTYCTGCGKKMYYISPNIEYANKYMQEYSRINPLREGEHYSLLEPATLQMELDGDSFGILKTSKDGRVSCVYRITNEDIKNMKKNARK